MQVNWCVPIDSGTWSLPRVGNVIHNCLPGTYPGISLTLKLHYLVMCEPTAFVHICFRVTLVAAVSRGSGIPERLPFHGDQGLKRSQTVPLVITPARQAPLPKFLAWILVVGRESCSLLIEDH